MPTLSESKNNARLYSWVYSSLSY